MDNSSIEQTLLFICFLIVGFNLWSFLSTPYRRKRLRQRISCFFGSHSPGLVMPAPGGRNIQYCDYCDKKVREYQVTKGQAQNESPTIRRIY